MSDRVVISADSHTERFLDLSEYIDPKHRPKMDELNKRDEARLQKILANMRARGQETSYSGRKNTMEEFRITVDLGDRMSAITDDGICAEVVIERGGSRSTDIDFVRACNSAYYRWFSEHFAPRGLPLHRRSRDHHRRHRYSPRRAAGSARSRLQVPHPPGFPLLVPGRPSLPRPQLRPALGAGAGDGDAHPSSTRASAARTPSLRPIPMPRSSSTVP